MTVDDLPPLNPPSYGDIRDPERPILSFTWQADGPHRAAAHSHPRAHIINPTSGALWVVTPEGNWLVPPSQAIWIPPRIHHDVYSHGPLSARMIFVDPEYALALPARCGTVAVSPLLSELLRRAVEYGNEYPAEGPAARLARVMLDELAAMNVAPLLLPIARDPRLVFVMGQLISTPGSQADLAEIARAAGVSPRTLTRLFRDETGMTFTAWRTRLRLLESIERLARGASVTEVAMDLGYRNTSSFIHVFRTNIGVSPGRYRERGRADPNVAMPPRI